VNVRFSPFSKESYEVVTLVLSVEHCGEEVEVGDKGTLENDGDVRGVEELDGVRYLVASHLSVAQSKFNAESLEINDNEEDNHCCKQTGDIGGVFSVEGMLNGHNLVRLGQERVEESNDSTFEFGILVGLDGDGGETLPQDDLADVGGDEERNTVSETVSFLEEFIKKLNDDSSKGKLRNNQKHVN